MVQKNAKEYVTKYPEITLKMSIEKIGNMKAKVNGFVKNAEKIVKGEFDNPALWWHQKPSLRDPIYKYKQVADQYPEAIIMQ